MRLTMIALATLLLMPAASKPVAGGTPSYSAQPTDFSAIKKKKGKKAKAPKVEYMRAVPSK